MPYFNVGDAQLYYEDYGQGQPIIFIHGVWMSSRFFKKQIPYFAERTGLSRLICADTAVLPKFTPGIRLPRMRGMFIPDPGVGAQGCDFARLVNGSVCGMGLRETIRDKGTQSHGDCRRVRFGL